MHFAHICSDTCSLYCLFTNKTFSTTSFFFTSRETPGISPSPNKNFTVHKMSAFPRSYKKNVRLWPLNTLNTPCHLTTFLK
ncbi:hypothetical protein FKM82_029694 [Ascaphus truei]